nr:hypothetical protein [Tanacetum cinerariifolium]
MTVGATTDTRSDAYTITSSSSSPPRHLHHRHSRHQLHPIIPPPQPSTSSPHPAPHYHATAIVTIINSSLSPPRYHPLHTLAT